MLWQTSSWTMSWLRILLWTLDVVMAMPTFLWTLPRVYPHGAAIDVALHEYAVYIWIGSVVAA